MKNICYGLVRDFLVLFFLQCLAQLMEFCLIETVARILRVLFTQKYRAIQMK